MKKLFISAILAMALFVTAGCGKSKQDNAEDISAKTEEASKTEESANEAQNESGETASDIEDKSEDVVEEQPEVSADMMKEAYMEFLKGNSKMKVNLKDSDWIEVGKEFSFDEMNKEFSEYLEDMLAPATISDGKYAFIDCGMDGTPELALNMAFSLDMDTANQCLVFKYIDGQVCLISSQYGYYRSYVDINEYGYITYGGSGGASVHYGDYRYINKDGEEIFLYTEQEDMAFSGPYISEYYFPGHEYPKGYPEDIYSYGDIYISCSTYNFNEYVYYEESDDEDYYKNNIYTFYDEEGNYVEPDADIAKIYKENNINYYDTDEVEKMLSEHLESLGVTKEIRDGKEPQWVSLLSEGIGKYSRNFNSFEETMRTIPGKWKMPEDTLDDGVESVFLSIAETGEFELNISYEDKYTSPVYASGHIVHEGTYYNGFYFYPTKSNTEDIKEKNYIGEYAISKYETDSKITTMTLECDSEFIFEKCSKLKKPVFEKESSDITYETYEVLSNPSDEYYRNSYEVGLIERPYKPVELSQTSCVSNDITDEDVWFNKVGMSGNTENYSDGNYTYRFGGTEYYGRKTMLYIYDETGKNLIKTFDFHDFIWARGYVGNSYVDRSIRYALIKDDVLYVNLYHRTYAETCPENAYIMAIDMNTGTIIWKSEALVSNSTNFVILGDSIITGYGFSAEDHYLSIVNRFTGEVAKSVPVKKSPEYFLYKDGTLYVRTYSYDYEFEVKE